MIYKLSLTALGHLSLKGNERFVEFIVSADSEEKARDIASKQDIAYGEDVWKDTALSSCTELDLNREVISTCFISKSNL